MKRLFLILMFSIVTVFAFSSPGFFISFFPVLSYNNLPVHDRDYRPTMYDMYDYFKYPAFATFGVELSGSSYRALLRFDFRQDLSAYLRGRGWSNLPLDPNKNSLYIDTDLPRVGLAEYENSLIRLSAGKRKLHFGPATYNFVLSETVPYFEHIWFDLNTEVSYGRYYYNFFIISSDRSVYNSPKTLIGHSFGFSNQFLRLGLVETNLISKTFPDLRDLSPFTIFHNNYARNSNVNAGIFLELDLDRFDMYGLLYADDILIPGDRTKNPTSLGWYAGGTYTFIDGGNYSGPLLWDSQFTLREKTVFDSSGGLKLKYEHYHSTPYLYNRDFEEGKYTNPIRFNAGDIEGGQYVIVNGFYGFPYGPDVTLDLLALSYETEKLLAEIRLEYLRSGVYKIDDYYGEPFEYEWYGLAEPITGKALLSFNLHYSPEGKQEFLFSSLLSFGEKLGFNFKVGYGKFFDF